MSDLLIPSFLVSDVSESLRSLTKNERCERISQVVHQKWVTMSESLTKNERIAHFLDQIAHSLIFSQKNEQFAQKTDEQIRKFPTLPLVQEKKNTNIPVVLENNCTLVQVRISILLIFANFLITMVAMNTFV